MEKGLLAAMGSDPELRGKTADLIHEGRKKLFERKGAK
jgi:hypothetical protein